MDTGKPCLMKPAPKRIRNCKNGEVITLSKDSIESALRSRPPGTEPYKLVYSPSCGKLVGDIFRDKLFSGEIPKFEIDYSLPPDNWYVVLKSDGPISEHSLDTHRDGWLHEY